MIRLIATDMDGTFVKDDKTIEKDAYELITTLHKMGVYFCVASGRQYWGLKKSFEAYAPELLFIADNGAYVVCKGEELYSNVMKPELVQLCLDKIYEYKHIEAMLCGKKSGYTTEPITYDIMGSSRFNYQLELVDDLRNVKNDDILKISLVYESKEGREEYQDLCNYLDGKVTMAVSGYECTDITNLGVSKGEAIEQIQKKLGISYEETLVFGDNYNDVDMFQKAYYSYAMKNAEKNVQKQARFITKLTNNENAVVKEIKELLNLQK